MIQQYDEIKNTRTDDRYMVTDFKNGKPMGILMKDGADTTPFLLPQGDYELLSCAVGEFDVAISRERKITI